MTINTPLDKVMAAGNGVATVFSFSPVTIFSASDLTVTFVSTAGVETVLTEGGGASNYSVSLSSPSTLPSTGSITYPASGGVALANGEQLIIARIVDLVQETDLGNQGGYFPEVQEAAFDYAMMVDIQQQDLIDRSIKLNTHTTGVSVELPNPVAGQGLIWNGGATALISAPLTLTADISSALVVVSASQPSLVTGRIWIDTSVGGEKNIWLCTGAAYRSIYHIQDVSGDITFTGTAAFLSPTAVSTSLTTPTETKQVNNNGAVGVSENNLHSSATPAVNDIIWQAQYDATNSTPAIFRYALDKVVIVDPTAASEDAKKVFQTAIAGTLADRLNIGAGIYTPAQVDKGVNTINATSLYTGGTLMAASDVSIQSGATHTPALSDHGKTFIYTAAGGCAVTIPAASGLFAGWKIYQVVATGAGVITNSRSSTDTLWSKNTSLTTLKLPSTGDGGSLTLDSTGGTAKFYWNGKRSYTSADFVTTINTSTVNAHSLGVVPDHYKTILVNTIANLNYSPGDLVDPTGFASAAAATGYANLADATNITTLMGAAGLAIPNKTTFATTVITTADWNFRTFASVTN